jgi:hypothetical protein
MGLDPWPACCAKNDDGDSTCGEILLAPQIGVCGDKNLKSSKFCSSEKFAVL